MRENEYNEYRDTRTYSNTKHHNNYENGKTIELGKDQYKVE